jgi:hypothetical protein
MNTAAECAERFMDPMLKRRHLRLLYTLKAAGIQATCGDNDEWMVTMPSARFYGWLSFDELQPPMGEWVVCVPRNPNWNMRVLMRIKPQGVYDMQDEEFGVAKASDYIFWMPKP